MLKVAKILGIQRALVEAGALSPYPTLEKAAQAATIASMATPEEVQTAGGAITQEDLMSLEKVLSVLINLQQIYQQSLAAAPAMGAPQAAPQAMAPPPPAPPMPAY